MVSPDNFSRLVEAQGLGKVGSWGGEQVDGAGVVAAVMSPGP